jgi:hypothetical protein
MKEKCLYISQTACMKPNCGINIYVSNMAFKYDGETSEYINLWRKFNLYIGDI